MTEKMLRGVVLAMLAGSLLLAGCKITKHEAGENAKVSVEVPGASVKVDRDTTAKDAGLPLYPGAQEKQKTSGGKERANVNVDTPFVKVKVVALEYTSGDAPEKVVAFYRDKLSTYGKVLECKGDGEEIDLSRGRGLNSPVACNGEHGHNGEISLKVGVQGNQHVVQVKPSGNGSEFTLIYAHLGGKKGEDDYSGKSPS